MLKKLAVKEDLDMSSEISKVAIYIQGHTHIFRFLNVMSLSSHNFAETIIVGVGLKMPFSRLNLIVAI